MKNALHNWKKLAKRAANAQMTAILFVVYFIIIIPSALIMRLFFKNIFKKFDNHVNVKSSWLKKMTVKQDIQWAKKQ